MTGAQERREHHGGGRWHRILYAAALLLAVLASGVFAYGFLRMNFVWDIGESCGLGAGQPYDSEYAASYERAWWQLSQPCNADFDLVAAWITPAFWALAAGAAALVILAVPVQFRAVTRADRRAELAG